VRFRRETSVQLTKLAAAVLAVVVAVQLARMPAANPPPPARQFDSPLPVLHGLALQVDRPTDLVRRYDKALQEIVALGANCVLISTSFYQEHAGSERIDYHADHTPRPAELRPLLERARSLGLRVVLMPKVLLASPRGNEWRGKIQPPDWEEWFAQYRRCILEMARAAAEARADVFMVGSELVTTERYTDEWRRIVREARQVFDGRLAYSANWDHYRDIEFWDDLDLIGMTTYYKLADQPDPSLETLVQSWQPIRKNILAWQRKKSRPLIFTEVGWCSQEGSAIEAWNYYRSRKTTPAALQEQKNLYLAFLQAWDDAPEVGGVIWWEWTIYQGGPADVGYTPRGKPAEEVLRDWFARHRKVAGEGAEPPALDRATAAGDGDDDD